MKLQGPHAAAVVSLSAPVSVSVCEVVSACVAADSVASCVRARMTMNMIFSKKEKRRRQPPQTREVSSVHLKSDPTVWCHSLSKWKAFMLLLADNAPKTSKINQMLTTRLRDAMKKNVVSHV